MVDALREARRVLAPGGDLVDVRPLNVPMVVEVVIDSTAIWAREVCSASTPEDVEAADVALQHALSAGWFACKKSLPFDLEIYCDNAAELSLYAQARKLPETEIPYLELEERRSELCAAGRTARLRCRRRWMLSTYRRK
jgi:hypothetical protein